MSTQDFYKKHFQQFDSNLNSDSTVQISERNEFNDYIETVDISVEVSSGKIDQAKNKLIDATNRNFFWKQNPDGSPKYQYLGSHPLDWNANEDLGYVVKKDRFVENLIQQTGRTRRAVEDQLEEIITESDDSAKRDRFQKFKGKFGVCSSKKVIAKMWSFRYCDSGQNPFNHTSIITSDLPFILALPD